MYKAPESSSRVKEMRKLFEKNNEKDQNQKCDIKVTLKRSSHVSDHKNYNNKFINASRVVNESIDKSVCLTESTTHSLDSQDIKPKVKIKQQFLEKSKAATNNSHENNQLSLLYTKPIPKHLRPKNNDNEISENYKTEINYVGKKDSIDSLKMLSSLSLLVHDNNDNQLTNSLKVALKKPLPFGPPPKKPPRTFIHSHNENSKSPKAEEINHNSSSDKQEINTLCKLNRAHGDPIYMLEKLENALKQKKTMVKDKNKSYSFDSTFKLKLNDNINSNSSFKYKINFNFLNSIGCVSADKGDQGLNCFFNDNSDNKDPIYAEPFTFLTSDNCKSVIAKRNYNMQVLTENRKISGSLSSDDSNSCDSTPISSPSLSDLEAVIPKKLEDRKQLKLKNVEAMIHLFEKMPNQTASSAPLQNIDEISKIKIKRKTENGSPEIIKKFENYVTRVRSKIYSEPSKSVDTNNLFIGCVIVGLNRNVPYIKSKFPKNVKLPHKIEELCFPDAQSENVDLSEAAQCYSLVITNESGQRTFGYCRRVLPEGSASCLPLAYCILTCHYAPGFYKKILAELESRHGFSEEVKNNFLKSLYSCKFPEPGEVIKIVDVDSTATTSEYFCRSLMGVPPEMILARPSDARNEENNLLVLCNSLPVNVLLQTFSSLLLERKVVIVSRVLSKLSSCVEALQVTLYPFNWPHTLIPVLPECLWEIVEAPTPLLCGVLSKEIINLHKIEHGIVVDLDEGSVLFKMGDEDKVLRKSLLNTWKEALCFAKSVTSHESSQNVLLSDAFLRVFVKSCGHYKDHTVDGIFKKNEFIESGKLKGRGIGSFLRWFTETTMFYAFIDSVLKDLNHFRIFDQRIHIYSSQASEEILKKMKESSREKKPFFG